MSPRMNVTFIFAMVCSGVYAAHTVQDAVPAAKDRQSHSRPTPGRSSSRHDHASTAASSSGTTASTSGAKPSRSNSAAAPSTSPQAQALAAIHKAEEAQKISHERLQKVSKAVQATEKLSSEAKKKAEGVERSISAMKAAKSEAHKALEDAKKAEKAARQNVTKVAGKKHHTPADKVAAKKDRAAAVAERKTALQNKRDASDRLKGAIARRRLIRKASKKRAKDLGTLLKKHEGMQQLFKERTELNNKLQKQVQEVDKLTAGAAKLRAPSEKQASKVKAVGARRVHTTRKLSMGSENTSAVREIVRRRPSKTARSPPARKLALRRTSPKKNETSHAKKASK